MSKIFINLLSGLRAVGRGMDMACSSMLPMMPAKPPYDMIFFRSDAEALYYDWQRICSDMQQVCWDMKRRTRDVH